jgi:hypothetical protein
MGRCSASRRIFSEGRWRAHWRSARPKIHPVGQRDKGPATQRNNSARAGLERHVLLQVRGAPYKELAEWSPTTKAWPYRTRRSSKTTAREQRVSPANRGIGQGVPRRTVSPHQSSDVRSRPQAAYAIPRGNAAAGCTVVQDWPLVVLSSSLSEPRRYDCRMCYSAQVVDAWRDYGCTARRSA